MPRVLSFGRKPLEKAADMGFQSIALGSGDGGTQVVDDIHFEFGD